MSRSQSQIPSTAPSWPAGVTAAATVTVNFDAESVEHQTLDLPLWGRDSHGRYGAQVGVFNLLDLFARHDVRATFFISAWDVERYPWAMAAIASAGHELAGHGYRYEDFSASSLAEQTAILERSEATFESAFGQRPLGFRAPGRRMSGATRALLAGRGYRFDSSYADDDRPYLAGDGDAGEDGRLVELPVHEPWSDRPYYERHRPPQRVAESWLDEFDATYAEGGLFTLEVHPRGDYGSGRGSRVRAIGSLLASFREHPGTWVATCGEIAGWSLTGTT